MIRAFYHMNQDDGHRCGWVEFEQQDSITSTNVAAINATMKALFDEDRKNPGEEDREDDEFSIRQEIQSKSGTLNLIMGRVIIDHQPDVLLIIDWDDEDQEEE